MSAAGLILCLLLACQAQPRPPAEAASTRAAESAVPALPEGRVFEVLPAASELRIVVYPAGTLARFGHAHVIGGAAISGRVVLAEPFGKSALRLQIDARALEVDRPEWREDEGFDPELAPEAIAGTRANMRSAALLDVDNHPSLAIESLAVNGPAWQPDIDLRITLRGQARELTVPVALSIDDHQLIATGRLLLRQSDFGLEPFSAAGGNLQVADQFLVRFRIVARK